MDEFGLVCTKTYILDNKKSTQKLKAQKREVISNQTNLKKNRPKSILSIAERGYSITQPNISKNYHSDNIQRLYSQKKHVSNYDCGLFINPDFNRKSYNCLVLLTSILINRLASANLRLPDFEFSDIKIDLYDK